MSVVSPNSADFSTEGRGGSAPLNQQSQSFDAFVQALKQMPVENMKFILGGMDPNSPTTQKLIGALSNTAGMREVLQAANLLTPETANPQPEKESQRDDEKPTAPQASATSTSSMSFSEFSSFVEKETTAFFARTKETLKYWDKDATALAQKALDKIKGNDQKSHLLREKYQDIIAKGKAANEREKPNMNTAEARAGKQNNLRELNSFEKAIVNADLAIAREMNSSGHGDEAVNFIHDQARQVENWRRQPDPSKAKTGLTGRRIGAEHTRGCNGRACYRQDAGHYRHDHSLGHIQVSKSRLSTSVPKVKVAANTTHAAPGAGHARPKSPSYSPTMSH